MVKPKQRRRLAAILDLGIESTTAVVKKCMVDDVFSGNPGLR
jgi:hypothetical protein